MGTDKTKNAQANGADVRDLEPHWGDPERSQPRRDTTRSERVAGIVWLSVGAVVSVLLAVLYLGSRVTFGSVSVPFPWPLVVAPWFNYVLSKTALLWTDNRSIASIPLWTWLAGYALLLFWPALPGTGGDTVVASNIWSLLLLPAGAFGGGWAFLRLK
ncbi:MAG TPA: hypothetical protein H9870_00200 [Candidatus Corynebacterium avicola]|uniref:Uncharacterized protein n=1 Tax=Candidatus Corynebacterium avicola TaxID=2838527 RepID=A0A9D1RNS3_9CORY|nr:hypothetical protein [Candidatus Corynebacterium avicola]